MGWGMGWEGGGGGERGLGLAMGGPELVSLGRGLVIQLHCSGSGVILGEDIETEG